MPDVQECMEFMQKVNEAESENRQLAMIDLKFRFGEQWPQYAVASRGLDRPQLTINEIDSYIRQVTNMQRQQRPRMKAQPIDDFADKKIAKIITGIFRHIEVNSDADHAYDTAFDFAATMGWGYWRLRTDYIANDTFNQDIFIDCINNPFTVYFDYMSQLPDGSDGEKCCITDLFPKKNFEKLYPDAQTSGFTERGTGDNDPDWATENAIRVAEYFWIDRKKAKLVALSDGSFHWEDKLPPEDLLRAEEIVIVGDRESFKKQVKWQKQTAFDVLEEKDLPGRYLPVVPLYWTQIIIDDQRLRQGMVRPAIDPQRMVNFWQTAATEFLALAPKPKWLIAEGQDEGHEKEFQNANLSATAVLRYKPTDVSGKPVDKPERIAPDPPPSGFLEAAQLSNVNLQRVMGMFDPAVRSQNDKSGKAIIAERSQSEMSNFHGYDNLTRSMKHTGRIILDYIPAVLDTQRIQRIIGEDGKEDLVQINQPVMDSTGQAIQKILNDVRVGTYDVVMETGPGYDTKRQEGVAATMELMRTPVGEKVAAVADDLIVRQMDFPGADMIADRLAAANPLSQIDEKSEIPPQVQMQIKALQGQVQKAQQIIQQLEVEKKFRLDVESMKQQGETRRALMKETNDAHERLITREQKQHDTEMYALTAQNVAEINGLVRILTSKTEHAHRLREMLFEFEHQVSMQDRQLENKSNQQEIVQ